MRKGATGNLKSKLALNPATDWNSVAPLKIRVTGHLYCPGWSPTGLVIKPIASAKYKWTQNGVEGFLVRYEAEGPSFGRDLLVWPQS